MDENNQLRTRVFGRKRTFPARRFLPRGSHNRDETIRPNIMNYYHILHPRDVQKPYS